MEDFPRSLENLAARFEDLAARLQATYEKTLRLKAQFLGCAAEMREQAIKAPDPSEGRSRLLSRAQRFSEYAEQVDERAAWKQEMADKYRKIARKYRKRLGLLKKRGLL